MGLEKYKKKRDFKKTPEPEDAKDSKNSLRFVVQKHDARRLHYDLRLQAGGVLKSWAVPKGPTLDPDEKRLAVMVEDHPLAYQNFEGIIPEGNYGAGTVMVWDKGAYNTVGNRESKQVEEYVLNGIEKGSFDFVLNGRKLKGAFVLARLKDSKNWLLIKKNDRFVGGKIENEEISVKTGRSFKQISEGTIDLTGVPKGEMPKGVRPMLATLIDKPFSDPEWVFEVKWDGYRTISEIKNKKINIYSRNQNGFNDLFPSIVESLRYIKHDAVLDGEIVSLKSNGKPDFQDLQNYKNLGTGTLTYYIFDLLFLDGHDLTSLPLLRRKEILKKIIPKTANIKLSEHIEKDGEEFFKAVKSQGLEGIIAKNKASVYQIGTRGKDWLKIKNKLRQEFVIVGYTEPLGSRQHFGSLLLAIYEDGNLRYTGNVGTGFDEKRLGDIKFRLDKIKTKRPPVKVLLKAKNVTWVKPELICEVTFQEWTKEGYVRQAVFAGLREDISPKQIRKEVPGKEEIVLKEKNEQIFIFGTKNLTIRNLDKIFWPDEAISKRMLLQYYLDISSYILPHLLDRPETLKRYPDGIDGNMFYHKDLGGIVPKWVKTYKDYSGKDDKYIEYMLANDLPSLLYMINMAAIEMHPWTSRITKPDYPDFIVIDLDPLEIDFRYVAETTLAVKEVLDELGIKGYPKTSGATGMHIYIPLGARYNFEEARNFAEILANLVHTKKGEITSVERNPDKRKGKVYLDFLQNRKGQTTAAPYSVRPLPGAPVSTPLKWDEINEALDPKEFTIFTVPSRVKKIGDIFKGVLGKGIDMEKVLKKISDF